MVKVLGKVHPCYVAPLNGFLRTPSPKGFYRGNRWSHFFHHFSYSQLFLRDLAKQLFTGLWFCKFQKRSETCFSKSGKIIIEEVLLIPWRQRTTIGSLLLDLCMSPKTFTVNYYTELHLVLDNNLETGLQNGIWKIPILKKVQNCVLEGTILI